MKGLLISLCAGFTMIAGVALAQEFTTTRHLAPQSEPARPPVEQNSNSSCFRKFMAARNKLQLVNPMAPDNMAAERKSLLLTLKIHRRGPMPCDCSPSHFALRSHTGASRIIFLANSMTVPSEIVQTLRPAAGNHQIRGNRRVPSGKMAPVAYCRDSQREGGGWNCAKPLRQEWQIFLLGLLG